VKGAAVVRLIVGVLILIVLGVLFAMNGTNVTNINLFGYQMQDVPIIAVAIAGFVLGVLYSFILYFMRFLARRRRASLQNRDRSVRERERTVQDREKRLETLEEDLDTAGEGIPEETPRERRRKR
jgi:uncharacterized integral membrane protein